MFVSSSLSSPSSKTASPLHLLTYCLLFLTLIPFTTATCYWANSTLAPNDQYSIAPDDIACFPNQQNSPCCGTGWSCLSDGVCYIRQGTGEYYYRGTCTDKTWGSQQCPGWCFAQDNKTSIPLAKCKKATGEDWYCCPGDANCNCTDGRNAVKLGASQPTTVTVIGSTSWPGYAGSSTSMSITTSATSAVTTGTAASAATTGSSTASTSPSASTSTNNTSGGQSNTALAAGLGAGVGVLVIIIGAVGIFLYKRRQKRRAGIDDGNRGSHPGYTSPAPAYIPGKPPVSGTAPRPGEGYYATTIVNEKDGRKTFPTQEMDVDRTRFELGDYDSVHGPRGIQRRSELS